MAASAGGPSSTDPARACLADPDVWQALERLSSVIEEYDARWDRVLGAMVGGASVSPHPREEASVALALSVIEQKKYCRTHAAEVYERHGVIIAGSARANTGACLRRIAPVAALADAQWRAAAEADCALTHPDPVCVAACVAYVAALRELYAGKNATTATAAAIAAAGNDVVVGVISAARVGLSRHIATKNALSSLYCAFCTLFYPGNFFAGMARAHTLGGDTETNLVVAGTLLGAAFGYSNLHIDAGTLLPSVAPRPRDCAPGLIPEVALALAGLAPAGLAPAGPASAP